MAVRWKRNRERFPVSDHCDGGHFFNPFDRADRSMVDVYRWWRTRAPVPWPEFVPVEHRSIPTEAVLPGRVAITFIGHSTFLIRTSTASLITDPVFTTHAGPFGRFGPQRVREPAVPIDRLPHVDVVLVSHSHYDHLQPSSIRELDRRFAPTFVTPLGLGAYLRRMGASRTIELDWWGAASDAADVQVTCTPAQHFSARTLRDRNRTLWGGFLIRSSGATVYFAGDSGYAPHFKEIGARTAPIDVALLPIGAYEPRWFMKPMHMNPEEAVAAHIDARARVSVAMHFGTFRLTDEAIDEPPQRLTEARATAGLPADSFRIPEFGQTLSLQAGPGISRSDV